MWNTFLIFTSISELVKHDVNGLIFSNSDKLAKQLEVSLSYCFLVTQTDRLT